LLSQKELTQAMDHCAQALALVAGHIAALELLCQLNDALALVETHYKKASSLFDEKALPHARTACGKALGVFPTYEKALTLNEQIEGALQSAEQHYAKATSLFMGKTLLDTEVVRMADATVSEALKIWPSHSAALQFHAMLAKGLAVDRAFQHADAMIGEKQFAAAATSLAEGVQTVQAQCSGDPTTYPLQFKLQLIECFGKMALCDSALLSPPPIAERLYSRVIALVASLPLDQQGNLRQVYHKRAMVWHCHGNMEGAAADMQLAMKFGSDTAETDWIGHLRDHTLIQHMARAIQGAEVCVEIFLNERWVPTRGYSSGEFPVDTPLTLGIYP
jgi:tetratricopeptide (TPR) repeat protein